MRTRTTWSDENGTTWVFTITWEESGGRLEPMSVQGGRWIVPTAELRKMLSLDD